MDMHNALYHSRGWRALYYPVLSGCSKRKKTNPLAPRNSLTLFELWRIHCLLRKNADQYEVAFSPDPGYLFGESVWHYFKRPLDLVYCEAIPNTSEAILVIVKAGIVYLDGSFPLDSIFDEISYFSHATK